MKRHYYFKGVFLVLITMLILSTACAYGAEESITVTTYYPSPYGVYSEMRLYPKASATACNSQQEGLMYYDNNAGKHVLRVCGGSPLGWQDLGGGYWAASPSNPNNIYNTNSGNVGIGTTNPLPSPGVSGVERVLHIYNPNSTGVGLRLQSTGIDGGIAIGSVGSVGIGLGTASYHALQFFTSTLERMRIAADGNVGIGKDNPAERLDVLGNANVSGAVKVGNLTSINNGIIAFGSGFNVLSIGGPTGSAGFGQVPNGDIGLGLTIGTTAMGSFYYSQSSNAIYMQSYGFRPLILNGGKVGIGIGPWAQLDVYGSAINVPGFRTLNSAYNRYIFMVPELGPGGYNGLSQNGDSGIFFTNLGAGLVIGPWGNYGIRIAGSGDVGIGTSPLSGAVGSLTQRLRTGNRLSFSGWYNSGGPGQPYLEFNIDNVALFGISVWPSSKKNKTDIADIEVNTENIYNLRPVSFYYKDQKDKILKNFGLIAEEAEEFFPQLVMRSSKNNEIIGFDYGRLSVLVLNEVKKLKKEIESLKAQIEKLEEKEADLKNPR